MSHKYYSTSEMSLSRQLIVSVVSDNKTHNNSEKLHSKSHNNCFAKTTKLAIVQKNANLDLNHQLSNVALKIAWLIKINVSVYALTQKDNSPIQASLLTSKSLTNQPAIKWFTDGFGRLLS